MEGEQSATTPAHSGADPSPLFPVGISLPPPQNRTVSNATTWLANTSFNTGILSSIQSPPPPIQQPEPEIHEKAEKSKSEYPILGPSSSEEHSNGSKDDRKGKKRKSHHEKKKKKRKIDKYDEYEKDRKSKVKVWADSSSKLSKDYFFDVRGDPDNLAFGSLYRMDVPRYRHDRLARLTDQGLNSNENKKISPTNPEWDSVVLEDKSREGGRYYCTKYVSIERRKDLRRLRVNSLRRAPLEAMEDFVSLKEEEGKDDDEQKNETEVTSEATAGETWDEFVTRRTKEFNVMTRERPHDESLWISFANFQDHLITGSKRKSIQIQALEKKISILEKALEFNPGSEELLLLLMETCRRRDNSSILIQKWENVLKEHQGSYRLWRNFIQLCQGEFTTFSVSNMRKVYSHAICALFGARDQTIQKISEDNKRYSVDKELVEKEQALVDIFVSLCRFEWQTGHKEQAIGLFQAEIEYALFSPLMKLSEGNKKRLFKYFWSSEGARIGEDGSLGWANWLEKYEQQRKRVTILSVDSKEDEQTPGGWTGWSEKPFNAIGENVRNDEIQEKEQENEGELEEAGTDGLEDEDLESLLERLGLNLDKGKDVEVKDTQIWKRWSDEEARRDCEQWIPLHETSDEEQISRVILFEDIQDFLFSLDSEKARFSLIAHFVDFCDGSVNNWTCTNSATWKDKVESLDILGGAWIKEMEEIRHHSIEKDMNEKDDNLQRLLGAVDWINEADGRAKFLRNVLLHCVNTIQQNKALKEALFNAQGLAEARETAGVSKVDAIRPLAKRLLKNNRQDLILCGAYAKIEAGAGNIDLARKIFDMALLALNDLSEDYQKNAPILYLCYAEAEVLNNAASSKQRAIHILSCLGCAENYAVFPSNCSLSSTRILKARRGFAEQLRKIRSFCGQGEVTEHSSTLVASAALFEELTSGWEAAARIFEDAFSMVLPGRRRECLQLEILYLYYIQLLEKHKGFLRPKQIWNIELDALKQFPYNSRIIKSVICNSPLPAFTCKIRRLLDEVCQRNPSSTLCLFAIAFELGKNSTGQRIHRLFERALSHPETQHSVSLWRCYLAYELFIQKDADAARRIFFRAVHCCPWSKALWLDGFQKLNGILTAKELSDLQEVMREKELRVRTDIYEILLEDETQDF